MFIIDCLIGNEDRHNGNWGFLKNIKNENLTFAPIYDCGSCLFSVYTDEKMQECLENSSKMQGEAYNGRSMGYIRREGK